MLQPHEGRAEHFQERKRPGQVPEVWFSDQAWKPSKHSTGELGVSAAGLLPFSCRRRVSHGGEDTGADPHPRRALCREGTSVPRVLSCHVQSVAGSPASTLILWVPRPEKRQEGTRPWSPGLGGTLSARPPGRLGSRAAHTPGQGQVTRVRAGLTSCLWSILSSAVREGRPVCLWQ